MMATAVNVNGGNYTRVRQQSTAVHNLLKQRHTRRVVLRERRPPALVEMPYTLEATVLPYP